MKAKGLVTDFYQLTMAQGLFRIGQHEQLCVFDRTYRDNPFGGAYTVVAGLSHLIEFINNFHYGAEEIEYLRSLGRFDEDFLAWLKDFRFTGDIYAMPEGTIAFPGEVLLRVHAPKAQALLLETGLTMIMNHESLIATKARRVRTVSGTDNLMEFGLRRAQGEDSGHFGARAAMIGGFNGTSNVEAGRLFGIPVLGTMAHSWVMSFSKEIDSFREYARQYDNPILLVDTYHTLESGLPNAIEVFRELREAGRLPKIHGIRLDSGDLAYLSKMAHARLTEAGFTDAIITASNDLDENLIASLKTQGAKINSWGVGTKIIIADGTPALGGIYKLAGQYKEDETFEPKMKISDNPTKITNPGIKDVRRFYHRETGKMIADLICLADEKISETEEYTLVNENYRWQRRKIERGSFYVKNMLRPIFYRGKVVYEDLSLEKIVDYANEQVGRIWDEYLRLDNPEIMSINISMKLQELKNNLIEKTLKQR